MNYQASNSNFRIPIRSSQAELLGEVGGTRGANQTSPDVAFGVVLENGERGLILTEVKFTEKTFQSCSGRKDAHQNQESSNCLDVVRLRQNYARTCWFYQWDRPNKRKYWDKLRLSDNSSNILNCCPAARDGYQLMRQQALAEELAQSGEYAFVMSCVAYDARNSELLNSLASTGIARFPEEWGQLFEGRSHFGAFTHQDWFDWVRAKAFTGRWNDWLGWIGARYAYR